MHLYLSRLVLINDNDRTKSLLRLGLKVVLVRVNINFSIYSFVNLKKVGIFYEYYGICMF